MKKSDKPGEGIPERIDAAFGPRGPLAAGVPEYRARPQQVEMAVGCQTSGLGCGLLQRPTREVASCSAPVIGVVFCSRLRSLRSLNDITCVFFVRGMLSC